MKRIDIAWRINGVNLGNWLSKELVSRYENNKDVEINVIDGNQQQLILSETVIEAATDVSNKKSDKAIIVCASSNSAFGAVEGIPNTNPVRIFGKDEVDNAIIKGNNIISIGEGVIPKEEALELAIKFIEEKGV